MKKIVKIIMLFGVFMIVGTGFVISREKPIPMQDKEYVAVNPPTDSGEMVIEELEFTEDTVTMKSGDVAQTVNYQYEKESNQLIMKTEFGDFSYYIELLENGFIIDGVEYQVRAVR